MLRLASPIIQYKPESILLIIYPINMYHSGTPLMRPPFPPGRSSPNERCGHSTEGCKLLVHTHKNNGLADYHASISATYHTGATSPIMEGWLLILLCQTLDESSGIHPNL